MKTPEKILIADDDRHVRRIFSDILRARGYDPLTAENGTKAKSLVLQSQSDIAVALIDLKLGDMPGLELMEEIKALSPKTECIIVTGHASQDTIIEAINLGAYSYVPKSYETEHLLLNIRRACDKRNAELALRESEEKYRSLAATTDLMFLVDGECRFLFMNEGYIARHAVALEDIIGKEYGDFHSEEETKKFADKVAQVFKTGMPTQQESYDCHDGYFLKTLSPVKDHKGETKAVTIVAKDITAYKKVEDALRESEARYRSVFEGTNTATVIIEDDMTISMLNTAFEKLSGYSKREVEGHIKWTHFLVQEEIEKMENYIKRRKKDGRALTLEHETTFVDKKGIEKNIFLTIGTIPGTGRSVCSILDTTRNKRDQEALRKNEERYRALFDHNPIETIIVDREARVTGYNRAKATSGSRLPEINKDLMYKDYATKHSRDMFEELIECIRSGISKEFLEQGYKERFLDIKIAPFSEGAIITSIDVTNRKRAEAQRKDLETQLQQAQKMKAIGTLAGGLAHDFNNILMGIQGNVSLTLLDMKPSHPHYEKLRNIEQYVKGGAQLTGQLLGFARGGKYEVKPTNLNILLEKSSNMFGRTKKEMKIYKKYQEDIWMVDVDQSQIEQTILNIYVNAWQAMPGGGEIYIHTENVVLDKNYLKPHNLSPGNYVKISITDTGIGMDEETAKRVFDPFFTTKEMGRGTGLGMASAYGIIKNHNGIITLYSEKDIGSTFNIYLPARGEEESGKEEKSEEKQDALMGNETILLIDDEDLIIDVGEEILKFLGYKVYTAKSGREAINVYKEKRNVIDMVILDMIMPEIGGGETYNLLREINPEIKVLLSSGYSINGKAREILDQGCDGFIQKPFTIEQLSYKIRELLDGIANSDSDVHQKP